MMKHTCIITNEKEINVLKIRTHTSASELANTLGSCYGRIMQHLQEGTIQMSGAPFVIYYNMDMNDLDIEVGIPIASKTTGDGEVTIGVIASGKFLSTIHSGPYETVEKAYQDLGLFIEENNLNPTGLAYEFYLNDPSEVRPEDIQTKIMFPLV